MNLLLETQAEGQDVYFVNEADPAGQKAERIISVSAKKVVFQVPAALSAGDWTVEVRCGFGSIICSARLALPVTAA